MGNPKVTSPPQLGLVSFPFNLGEDGVHVGDDKRMCRYGTRTHSLRRRRCLCRYGTVGYDTVRHRSLVNVHNDSTRTVRVRKCDDR